MTDESICARCAELIRVKVRRHGVAFEKRVCSVENIGLRVWSDDTVEECSRFVEAPGEEGTILIDLNELAEKVDNLKDDGTGEYPYVYSK